MTYPTIAHMLVALRSLNQLHLVDPEWNKFKFFEKLELDVEFSAGEIRTSKLYENNRDFWNSEILIACEDGRVSIDTLIKSSPNHLQVDINNQRSQFYNSFINYVLEENFEITVEDFEEKNQKYKRYFLLEKSKAKPEMREAFEPLTFLNFENSSQLMLDRRLNIEHPFIKWYSKAYKYLSQEYFHYSKQLIFSLYGGWGSQKPEIQKINSILSRLRLILPSEIRPPKEIDITLGDVGLKE